MNKNKKFKNKKQSVNDICPSNNCSADSCQLSFYLIKVSEQCLHKPEFDTADKVLFYLSFLYYIPSSMINRRRFATENFIFLWFHLLVFPCSTSDTLGVQTLKGTEVKSQKDQLVAANKPSISLLR